MSEWKHEELRKVSKKIGDGLHGTPKYRTGTNYYFINGNNLKNGKIDISENTKEVDISEVQKYYIDLDDYSLLMGINGTIGNLAFYRGESILLGKSSAYIAFDSDINKFYYYYFQLKGIKKYFYEVATGSTIKNLSLKSLQTMRVPVPSKSEYKNIVNVLERLDQKIALNNQINEELEAMAKTLYDYWFVQFDFPDENGKPYKSSGGKMVYNDQLKREIPEGWGVKRVSEVAKTGSGGTPKSTINEYYSNGKIPWINSGELNKSIIISTTNYITERGLENSSAKLFPANSILIAMYGATAGKVSFLTFESSTNQAICAVTLDDSRLKYYFKFFIEDLYLHLVTLSSGSARDNLSQELIRNLLMTLPDDRVVENFFTIVNTYFLQITNNLKQNQELTQLRDWLLPMLMNGQVKVEEKCRGVK